MTNIEQLLTTVRTNREELLHAKVQWLQSSNELEFAVKQAASEAIRLLNENDQMVSGLVSSTTSTTDTMKVIFSLDTNIADCNLFKELIESSSRSKWVIFDSINNSLKHYANIGIVDAVTFHSSTSNEFMFPKQQCIPLITWELKLVLELA